MLKKRLILILLISFSSLSTINAQKRFIKKVQFDNNNIILNGKKAFDYKKEGNDFTILDLNGKKLITGQIRMDENGEWKSLIEFKIVNKTFSNKKIIGRNHLIFALAEENVINKDLKINKKRLLKFIKKYNELK